MLDLKKIKVCLMVFSTGRMAYLRKCLAFFHSLIETEQAQFYKILVNDLPHERDDQAYHQLVKEYGFDLLLLHEENLGLDRTIAETWKQVPADCQYLWHLEEDFIFLQSFSLDSLLIALETPPLKKCHQVAQLCFHRVDFYGRENNCRDLDQAETISWEYPPASPVTQTQTRTRTQTYNLALKKIKLLFGFGTCLYRRGIMSLSYGRFYPQEGVIAGSLKHCYPKTTFYTGFYRQVGDPPQTNHIGEYSIGFTVSPNMPGWDRWIGKGKWALAKQKGGPIRTHSANGQRYHQRGAGEKQEKGQVGHLLPQTDEILLFSRVKEVFGKNWDQTTAYYQEFLAFVQDPELKYYAQLCLARCYQKKRKQPDLIVNTYQQALKLFPTRPEAWYFYALHWSGQKKWTLAGEWIRRAYGLLQNHQKSLVEELKSNPGRMSFDLNLELLYHWKILDESANVAYYQGEYEYSYQLYQILIREQKYPLLEQDRIFRNLLFTEQALCPTTQKSRQIIELWAYHDPDQNVDKTKIQMNLYQLARYLLLHDHYPKVNPLNTGPVKPKGRPWICLQMITLEGGKYRTLVQMGCSSGEQVNCRQNYFLESQLTEEILRGHFPLKNLREILHLTTRGD